MAAKVSVSASTFYCQRALELCQIALLLAKTGKNKEAAEICMFISSLCAKSPRDNCKEESRLCRASAEARKNGRLEEANRLCLEARRICSKNYEVTGG